MKLLNKLTSKVLVWMTKKQLSEATLMDSKGNFIRPFDPTCNSLDLEIVGLALSRIMRFFGQTEMSVAQHSVSMAKIFIYLGHTEYAKQALLHEISEAFLGDLVSPLKKAFPIFKEIEESLIKKTFECYDLSYPMAESVHLLDKSIMINEACTHMPNADYWLTLGDAVDAELLEKADIDMNAWSSQKALQEFIDVAKQLELL